MRRRPSLDLVNFEIVLTMLNSGCLSASLVEIVFIVSALSIASILVQAKESWERPHQRRCWAMAYFGGCALVASYGLRDLLLVRCLAGRNSTCGNAWFL